MLLHTVGKERRSDRSKGPCVARRASIVVTVAIRVRCGVCWFAREGVTGCGYLQERMLETVPMLDSSIQESLPDRSCSANQTPVSKAVTAASVRSDLCLLSAGGRGGKTGLKLDQSRVNIVATGLPIYRIGN